MLTYCGLLDWFRPQWFVWENVPGVLSSNGGRDFGSFLGALAELGYGFAYRVLDAQYFGVAQRRRRVFVVGHFGDWRPAAKVLFESESLRGDSPPSRKARKETSVFTPGSIGGYRQGDNTLTARMHKGMNSDCNEGQTPVLQPIAMRESGQGYWMEDDKAGTLRAEGENRPSRPSHVIAQPIALAENTIGRQHMAVRRLTPVECERLQGFPDNYTDIKPKGKETPDGPRYKALGNSMAVPCMVWIGKRIAEYQACH